MTYGPVNAMSEFVLPRNFSEGLVADTRRRFQAACAASNSPPRRPMRGSGLGGFIDALFIGVGAPDVDDIELEPPQAAAAARQAPTVILTELCIENPDEGMTHGSEMPSVSAASIRSMRAISVRWSTW